jgi:hypothetical protein
MQWTSINSAPFDRDLELAVIEPNGDPHAVIFALPPYSRRLDQSSDGPAC